jgi:hypothetical protein
MTLQLEITHYIELKSKAYAKFLRLDLMRNISTPTQKVEDRLNRGKKKPHKSVWLECIKQLTCAN